MVFIVPQMLVASRQLHALLARCTKSDIIYRHQHRMVKAIDMRA